MNKFFEKYGDFLMPIFFMIFFAVLFLVNAIKIGNATEWNTESFRALSSCLVDGFLVLFWSLNISKISSNRDFKELKDLLKDKDIELKEHINRELENLKNK